MAVKGGKAIRATKSGLFDYPPLAQRFINLVVRLRSIPEAAKQLGMNKKQAHTLYRHSLVRDKIEERIALLEKDLDEQAIKADKLHLDRADASLAGLLHAKSEAVRLNAVKWTHVRVGLISGDELVQPTKVQGPDIYRGLTLIKRVVRTESEEQSVHIEETASSGQPIQQDPELVKRMAKEIEIAPGVYKY